MKKPITFADLFCGCGGFSYGFHRNAAFKCILAVDDWPAAGEVYARNFPRVPFAERDLLVKKNVNEIVAELKGSCDVLLGGPPCQGFSTLGCRRRTDLRSSLVDRFIDCAAAIQPLFIFMENVRGIESMHHSADNTFAQHALRRLAAAGYSASGTLVNMLHFGIAQTRTRWVLAAVSGRIPQSQELVATISSWLSKPTTHPKIRTLHDAIGDLPAAPVGVSKSPIILHKGRKKILIHNHVSMHHGKDLIQRLKHVPPNGGLLDVPRRLLTPHLLRLLDGAYGNGGHIKNIYGRMSWDQPSGTIVAGMDKITCGRFVHPEEDRLLTPRECARIQSFSDDFVFTGGHVTQYYLIGNAVPPKFSKTLASKVVILWSQYNVGKVTSRQYRRRRHRR